MGYPTFELERKMKVRTNIYLTENQSKKFKALSKKTGYSMAELIRRALDEWLEKQETKGKK
jgi:predicted DNA-binding protein